MLTRNISIICSQPLPFPVTQSEKIPGIYFKGPKFASLRVTSTKSLVNQYVTNKYGYLLISFENGLLADLGMLLHIVQPLL